MLSKKKLISLGLGAICIFLLIKFPTQGVFQQLAVFFVFFLLIPLLYIKMILKESVVDYGVKLRNLGKGILWILVLVLAYLPLLYLLTAYTFFNVEYNPSSLIQQSFGAFILYEIVLVTFFVIIYDFFFRGFLMIGILERTGLFSILIQFIVLVGIFYIADSLSWSNSLYVITAPFSGIIAYKTKSLYFSSLLALILILITDAWLILA